MRISVIGSSNATPKEVDIAESVGHEVATSGYELVCGGLEGVMEAAARGAVEAGGQTIGILPSTDRDTANPYIEVPIATGIGSMRNVMVVNNGDGVVAIGGHYGTLSEIAHALDIGLPVVGIDTHQVEGVTQVGSAESALEHLEGLL